MDKMPKASKTRKARFSPISNAANKQDVKLATDASTQDASDIVSQIDIMKILNEPGNNSSSLLLAIASIPQSHQVPQLLKAGLAQKLQSHLANAETSADIRLECVRACCFLSEKYPDTLAEFVNTGIVERLIAHVTRDNFLHTIYCLSVLCSASQKATAQLCKSTLPAQLITCFPHISPDDYSVPLELLYILGGESCRAMNLDFHTVLPLFEQLTELNTVSGLLLSAVCITNCRSMDTDQRLFLLEKSLAFLEKAFAAVGDEDCLMLGLEVLAKVAYFVNRHVEPLEKEVAVVEEEISEEIEDGDEDGEDVEMNLIEEDMVEMQGVSSLLEAEDEPVAISEQSLFYKWLQTQNVVPYLTQLGGDNQLLKVKALCSLNDLLHHQSPMFSSIVSEVDFHALYWSLLDKLFKTEEASGQEAKVYAMVVWTLGRGITEELQTPLLPNSDLSYFQKWITAFNASSSQTLKASLVGILGSMLSSLPAMQDSPVPAQIQRESTVFLLDQIRAANTGQGQVVAECINTLIDMYSPDSMLLSAPELLQLSESLAPLMKVLKSIDPRLKKNSKKSQQQSAAAVEEEEWRILVSEYTDVDEMLVRERLSDLISNLRRFIDYKKQTII